MTLGRALRACANEPEPEGGTVAKKSRKRRARAKRKANHGKRPNS